MGAGRSIAIVLLSMVLVFSLSTAIGAYALSEVLDPISFKPVVRDALVDMVEDQMFKDMDVDQAYQEAMVLCKGKTELVIPTEDFVGDELRISCEDVAETPPGELSNLLAGVIIDALIENAPDCSGTTCVTKVMDDPKNFGALFNVDVKPFFEKAALLISLVAVACAAGIILLSAPKRKGMRKVGFTVAFAGLPYVFIQLAKSANFGAPGAVQELIIHVLNTLANIYLIALVVGAAFVGLSYILWGIHFGIKKRRAKKE